MTAARASSLLAVTITLIVLIICGEMQMSSGATVQDQERSSASGLLAPRTFGRIRMVKNFMLPMMFLLGGIKMLLLFVAAVGVKTLFVAVSILVINISVGLAKVINFFKHSKYGQYGQYGHHSAAWASPEKTVNINIHSAPGHQLSLDTPPTAISSISSSSYPYARNDVIDSIYRAPAHSLYPNTFVQATAKALTHPYSQWQNYARAR
ncbi:uncharacterized protein LOC131438849 [Malaya genurostris]|uniref:uncharacterized protein LOC131438849 n=1 Tax=Malaya genurostris TaxID=325434 RepID=UPI0026F3F95B|nr:uncharacterized protein LOC131438849 [Malaya genurostris]